MLRTGTQGYLTAEGNRRQRTGNNVVAEEENQRVMTGAEERRSGDKMRDKTSDKNIREIYGAYDGRFSKVEIIQHQCINENADFENYHIHGK